MSEIFGNSDLLTPSLGKAQIGRAPYSTRTGFLTSFFGGPTAALAIGAINAYRVGRLRTDLLWQIPLMAVYFGFEFWLALTPEGQQFQHWFIAQTGFTAQRIQQKVIGLIIFGLSSLAHRREQRIASIMGIARPDGRWLGVGLVIVGTIINIALGKMSA